VTCKESNILKEFTTHGQLVREISLESSVVNPSHAVRLPSGLLVVCHGDRSDDIHRVCGLTADGQQVVMSYDGTNGQDIQSTLDRPTHVAIDSFHGYIYVADYNMKKIVVLNQSLVQVGEVKANIKEACCRNVKSPFRLCFDENTKCLYVAECWGSVAVYSISMQQPC
jgi:6-phosphogluconolactonase (cycloisomerase 2 family)